MNTTLTPPPPTKYYPLHTSPDQTELESVQNTSWSTLRSDGDYGVLSQFAITVTLFQEIRQEELIGFFIRTYHAHINKMIAYLISILKLSLMSMVPHGHSNIIIYFAINIIEFIVFISLDKNRTDPKFSSLNQFRFLLALFTFVTK